jgi:hypothetical protein
LKKIVDDLESTDEKEKEKLREMITNREKNPEGRLLLFRYLDFEARPGNSYRYRVRLVLYNPFTERKPEEVVSPEVAEGVLRKTEWSEPTAPTILPEDADYFVDKVDTSQRNIPNTVLNLFQWSTDSGTTVNAPVKTLVGQYVGGTEKTDVLRPVPETFEKEAFPFSTEDVLVDVDPRPVFDRSSQTDLQIPSNAKDVLGMSDQALVMNRFGELVSINSSAQDQKRALAESRLKEQNKFWEDIKNVIQNAAADLKSGLKSSKRGDDDEGGGDRRTGPKGPSDNPRRKAGGGKRGK